MSESSKLQRILEYIQERSGEIYDELSEMDHDDPSRSVVYSQISCFDEMSKMIKNIISEEQSIIDIYTNNMSKIKGQDEKSDYYLSHESWDKICANIKDTHPELSDSRIAETLKKKNLSITVFL